MMFRCQRVDCPPSNLYGVQYAVGNDSAWSDQLLGYLGNHIWQVTCTSDEMELFCEVRQQGLGRALTPGSDKLFQAAQLKREWPIRVTLVLV